MITPSFPTHVCYFKKNSIFCDYIWKDKPAYNYTEKFIAPESFSIIGCFWMFYPSHCSEYLNSELNGIHLKPKSAHYVINELSLFLDASGLLPETDKFSSQRSISLLLKAVVYTYNSSFSVTHLQRSLFDVWHSFTLSLPHDVIKIKGVYIAYCYSVLFLCSPYEQI